MKPVIFLLVVFTLNFAKSTDSQSLSHIPGPPYSDEAVNVDGRGGRDRFANPGILNSNSIGGGGSGGTGRYYPTPAAPYYTIPPAIPASSESPLKRPVAAIANEISSLLDTITNFIGRPSSISSHIRQPYQNPVPQYQYQPQPQQLYYARPRPIAYSASSSATSGGNVNQPGKDDHPSAPVTERPKLEENPKTNQISSNWPQVFTAMGKAVDTVAGSVYSVNKELTKLLDQLNRKP